MKTETKHSSFISKQRGSTLVVSLMFLLVTTLIATGVWRLAMQQERMAGNERDYQIAFEAAEAALRDAELDYFNVCARKDAAGASSVCNVRSEPIVGLQAVGNQSAGDRPADGSCSAQGLCLGKYQQFGISKLYDSQPDMAVVEGTAPIASGQRVVYGQYTRDSTDTTQKIANVSQQPAYIVEAMCYGGASNASGCVTIFRITAIGYGRRADTRVILQSFLEPPPSNQ
jgi:type IV pilus assembly protein PilX